MDKIQIQILDSSWSGVIDVNNDGKFPFALTSSIADISKISDRSGSWSFPFEVVSTKENDKFLEHLYYSSQKNYKNFDDKKEAKVIINGIDIDTGTVRIERIASKRNDRKYKWTFYGNNLDWVLLMASNTFQDLPYLDNTYTYNSTEVAGSWTNTAGDYNPLYAYIKRGNRQSSLELSTADFYPDYYLYDIIKEAFKSVGYSVESDWLELADTKKIIESFFGQNFKRTEEDLLANSAQVEIQGGLVNLLDNSFTSAGAIAAGILDLNQEYTSPPFTGTPVSYNLLTGNANAVFNLANGEYTAPYTGYYDFTITGEYYQTYPTGNVLPYQTVNYRLHNGSPSYLIYKVIEPSTTTTSGGFTTVTTPVNASLTSLYLEEGDVVDPRLYLYTNQVGSTGDTVTFGHNNINYKVELKDIILDGNNYNWKDVSDDKISLLKYVTDVAKVHNLYFRTNTTTKTVYIEPRDDFYKPITSAVDWTDKIYQGRQYELKYNSSFYKRNQFYGYKEDSNDKFLEEKTKELKEELMGVTHVFPDKFAEGTTSLRTEMLSPTFVYQDEFGVVCSHMIDDESGLAVPTTDFNPRLLYYEYDNQLSFDLSTDTSFTLDGTTYDTIPYALPFDYVQEGVTRANVSGNLSFKDLNNTNGRYTEYHSTTADEIVNGMTLYIYLVFDFVDYRNLDFRKPVYFDNRYPDIEGYWHIQKVSGFKNDLATKFELIQAKNYIKDTINPFNEGGDTVPYENIDFGANRMSSSVSNGRSEVLGFSNFIEGSNVAAGFNLTANGVSTTRLGVSNLDVSTDVFQLGAGTPDNPYSLIRVTDDGSVFFNDILVKGDNIKTVTSSTPATVDVLTYLCDTSSNDISILLPAAITKGKIWNIKKMSQNNKLRIFSARTIDDKSEIFVKSIYTSVAIQDDGANYIII